MRNLVYSDENLMSKVTTVKRFLDDGCGFYDGTKRQYDEFMGTVNSCIAQFGLHIDEFEIKNHGELTFLS